MAGGNATGLTDPDAVVGKAENVSWLLRFSTRRSQAVVEAFRFDA
jgi:hypothetical protein